MIFRTIIQHASSVKALEIFINEHLLDLTDVSNARFQELSKEKDDIQYLILSKISILNALDFSKENNRSFIIFLYDLCERLELSCIHTLYNDILQIYDFPISKRMEAIISFSLNISTNEEYLERFDKICSLLHEAYEEEEDNMEKVIATFFNYYINVLSIHPNYIIRLKEKITQAIDDKKYPFLLSSHIEKLLSYDTVNHKSCITKINRLKDKIFDRGKLPVHTTSEPKIETGSTYKSKLEEVDALIESINSLAWEAKKDSKDIYIGRGVTILKEEEELFEYIRRHWNMHKEKIKSGLDPLLPTLETERNTSYQLIDWGCGQGIASLVFLNYLQENMLLSDKTKIKKITLIELGEPALARAALHISRFFPGYSDKIETIQADLNELKIWDFANKVKNCSYIHLFSNILDIEEIRLSALIHLLTQTFKGKNHFICSSPYIKDITAARLNGFCDYFKKTYPDSYELHASKNNSKGGSYDEYWLCNNQYKNNCSNHVTCTDKGKFYNSETGCSKKWARILRVFSTTIL